MYASSQSLRFKDWKYRENDPCSAEGVYIVVKKAGRTSNEDLLKADGIIVGSPTYYGQISGKVKT